MMNRGRFTNRDRYHYANEPLGKCQMTGEIGSVCESVLTYYFVKFVG